MLTVVFFLVDGLGELQKLFKFGIKQQQHHHTYTHIHNLEYGRVSNYVI